MDTDAGTPSCCQSWCRHPDSPSMPLPSEWEEGMGEFPAPRLNSLSRSCCGRVTVQDRGWKCLPTYNTGAKFTFLQSVIMKRQTLLRLWQLLLKLTPKSEGATCWSPPLLMKGEEKKGPIPLNLQGLRAVPSSSPEVEAGCFARGNNPQFLAL